MKTLYDDIGGAIRELAKDRKSGLMAVKRKLFGDPLLTVYLYRGKPLYATSFLVKEPWWEGLFNKGEEKWITEGGNAFRRAAEKYGERYLQHLVEYTENVLKTVLTEANRSGWEVEVEVEEAEDWKVAEMFALDVLRRKVSPPPSASEEAETPPKSLVLSLIAGEHQHLPAEREEVGRSEEDVTLPVRAMGFSIIYVPGEEDRYGFLKALKDFGAPLQGEFERVRRKFIGVRGTFALLFPLFALVRFWIRGREVWALTVDLKKVIYALLYTDAAEELPKEIIKAIGRQYGITFAYREGKDTLVLLPPSGEERRITPEEFGRTYEREMDELHRLVTRAMRSMPKDLPQALKKIEIWRMLQKHPSPEEFKRAFAERFGVHL